MRTSAFGRPKSPISSTLCTGVFLRTCTFSRARRSSASFFLRSFSSRSLSSFSALRFFSNASILALVAAFSVAAAASLAFSAAAFFSFLARSSAAAEASAAAAMHRILATRSKRATVAVQSTSREKLSRFHPYTSLPACLHPCSALVPQPNQPLIHRSITPTHTSKVQQNQTPCAPGTLTSLEPQVLPRHRVEEAPGRHVRHPLR